MDFKVSPKHVRVLLPFNSPIGQLAFATEMSIQWFIGEGVWRFNVVRTRVKDEVQVDFNATVQPQKCQFGSPARVEDLVKECYIPRQLLKEEIWEQGGPRSLPILEGPTTITKFLQDNQGESLINSEEIRPDVTLGEYSWGLGDAIIGAFIKGATKIKHQFSQGLSQTWLNKGFNREEIERFIRDPYDPEETVSILR